MRISVRVYVGAGIVCINEHGCVFIVELKC